MRWENGRPHGESQWEAIPGLFQLPEMPTHHLAEGMNTPRSSSTWLNRTVLGIGLASLFSDWSHEIATTVMPAFLATMGVAAFWVGLIEGVSDGLSSFAKMASGYYTDKLPRRKPVAVIGYLVTALGTASFGLATAAWHVLMARAFAWLGRGVRTPVRKALLAGAVTKETYGRAFGFERMMDTLGAIVGPASAFFLLGVFNHHYPMLFAVTLIPSLIAVALIAFAVREMERKPVPRISFGERLRLLPPPFRKFLVAVGLFGAGDFAHTLLILLATQKLTPELGAAKAASFAVGFYVLHNVFYAGFAFIAGWLADRLPKHLVLATGYALAAVMALAIIFLPLTAWTLSGIFVLGGVYVAIEETLEDSFCAELVSEEYHGMAFGTLATVNGVGDFLSSIIVGALWTTFGTSVAFGYSAVLFATGSLLVLRTRTRDRSLPMSQ
jgi:MFS family permease